MVLMELGSKTTRKYLKGVCLQTSLPETVVWDWLYNLYKIPWWYFFIYVLYRCNSYRISCCYQISWGRGGDDSAVEGGLSLKLAFKAMWSDDHRGDGRPTPKLSESRSSNKPSTLKLSAVGKHLCSQRTALKYKTINPITKTIMKI